MKRWLQALSSALQGVVAHKLRSFLAILGIVIGIAAVVAMMSIGTGASARITSSIESLGSNLLFVRPGGTTQAGVRTGAGTASTLTLEDSQAIAQEIPSISAVAPVYSSQFQLVAGGQNTRSSVTGVTPEYQQVLNLQIADGEFISEYYNQSAMRVVVLGSNVKQTLFGTDDAIGQTINMGNIPVAVIGVLQSKGASMLGTTDDSIMIPLNLMYRNVARSRTSTGQSLVSSIIIQATDQQHTSDAVDEITSLLRDRHRVTEENDFTVTSQQDIIGTFTQSTQTLTFFLGAIAGISLLVGGIGVMNIMLVSVVERTREIGIIKALGAQEADIILQFFIEAAVLTVTGGIVGIIFGWGASRLVSNLAGFSTLVSPSIVLLAFSVATGIGLFFGFYPAWRASRLNPIEALRYE